MTSWLFSFSSLTLLWLFIARFSSPNLAVGVVVLLSAAVPTWCKIELLGMPLDVRVAATLFALGAYLFHPKASYPLKLGWIDVTMLFLIMLNLVSDTLNDGFSWKLPLRIYGEWCVPYLAGRLAFQDLRTMRAIAPFGIAVALLFGVMALVEALTSVRPWELLYGPRLDDRIPRNLPRFGLQRAWGCCGHPIYFGMLQLLYLPWLLRCWHTRERSIKDYLLRLVSLIGPVGVISTVSRAPVIGLLFFPTTWTFISIRSSRIIFAIALVGAIVVGIGGKDYWLKALHRFGGERLGGSGKLIVVDGKQVEKTSAMTRLYLLQVYRRAAHRAGLFGFGTQSVTGFPIRVPVGAEDSSALKNVWAIDNEYLLLTLRFGWLGGLTFALALGLAAYSWVSRSRLAKGRDIATCIYFGAAIMAVGFGLLTVWMPHDIGFPLLVLMGATSMDHTSFERN